MIEAKPPIVIQFDKSKTFVWLIGANVFVVAGGWLVFGNPTFDHPLLDNPWFIKSLGAVAVFFFGIAAYFFISKLMADGPGLVIDDTGIEDYSSAFGSKIYWKDVASIEVIRIKSQSIILFKVNNPQTYIEQAKGCFKRKMMVLNYKWYDTPLSISSNGLQISFEDLLQLITDRFEVV